MRRFIYISVIELVKFAPIILFISCRDISKSKNDVLLKIDNYWVTDNEFQDKLDRSFCTKEDLLDKYINAGLFIGMARNKYIANTEIEQKIASVKEKLLVKHLIISRLNEENIRNYELTRSLNRFQNRTLVVDYVQVPKKEKKIGQEIKQFLEAGTSVYSLKNLKTSTAVLWKNAGVKFYDKMIVKPGTFANEIEKKIVNLKRGDISIIKTSSGYHIIRFLEETIEKREPDVEKQETKMRLAKARKIEKGKNAFDDVYLNNKIKINAVALSYINFDIDPLINPSNNKIIASFNNEVFTEEEILKKINLLPENLQSLFINKSTRCRAVASLIMLEKGNKYEKENFFIEFRDNLLVEFYIKHKLNSSLLKGDTVTFLMNWFNEISTGNNELNLHVILKNEAIRMGIDKNYMVKMKIKEFKDRFKLDENKKFIEEDYLFPERFDNLNMLKINYSAIEKMDIKNNFSLEKAQIVAYSGNWKITVADIQKIIDKLTPLSRKNISKEDNATKLIYYLAKTEAKIKNLDKIVIDYKALNKIDYTGNSLDILNTYPMEMDTIGSLVNVCITTQKLRILVSELPDDVKIKFYDKISREDALKQLLIQKLWLSNNDVSKITNENSFINEFNKVSNWILAEQFYKNQIFINPIKTNDEQLNFFLRKTIKELIDQKIESYLLHTIGQSKITIQRQYIDKFGIELKKSKYSKYIQINN